MSSKALPSQQSFFEVARAYLATASGLKNMVAKPICFAQQFFSMAGYPPSQSLLPAHMKAFKAFVSASEALTKGGWMVKASLVEGQRTVREAMDWTMSAYDMVVYLNSAKIVVISKTALFKGLCVFNAASVTYSVLCIKDELEKYAAAKTTHASKPQMLALKKTSMVLGVAVAVAYLALFVFSIPALLGLSVAVKYAAYLYLAQWICSVAATTALVAKHFHDHMYLKGTKKTSGDL